MTSATNEIIHYISSCPTTNSVWSVSHQKRVYQQATVLDVWTTAWKELPQTWTVNREEKRAPRVNKLSSFWKWMYFVWFCVTWLFSIVIIYHFTVLSEQKRTMTPVSWETLNRLKNEAFISWDTAKRIPRPTLKKPLAICRDWHRTNRGVDSTVLV